jgi:hypothetical protein
LELFIIGVEDKGIASFPYVPRDGCEDSGGFIARTAGREHAREGWGVLSKRSKLEELPDLPSAVAGHEEVVDVFVKSARRASSGVRESVSEPSLIGGDATSLCKPTEDLALQRCSTPPNPGCQFINLQVPESKGIEILV